MVKIVFTRRQYQNRYRVVRPEASADAKTVLLWQAQVQDDKSRRGARDLVDDVPIQFGNLNPKAVLLQIPLDEVGQTQVVLNKEYQCTVCVHHGRYSLGIQSKIFHGSR